MRKATELRETTTTAIHTIIAKRQEEARKVLSTRIVPQMEIAAVQGKFWIDFHVDAGVDIETISGELKANGYKVTKAGRMLKIDWV
jgi:hypothetical protein